MRYVANKKNHNYNKQTFAFCITPTITTSFLVISIMLVKFASGEYPPFLLQKFMRIYMYHVMILHIMHGVIVR